MRHLERSKNKKQLPSLGLKEPGKEIVFPEAPRDRPSGRDCPIEGRGKCQESGAKVGKEEGRNTLTFLCPTSIVLLEDPIDLTPSATSQQGRPGYAIPRVSSSRGAEHVKKR